MVPLAFALALMASAAPAATDGALALAAAGGARMMALGEALDPLPPPAEPIYAPTERAVSNWRREAVGALQPMPLAALAIMLQVDRPVVTRCVKLNNYWCIKRARWNGEIGYDEEGHTGFATAERGADAAVTLLRRYYLEYDRRSALDIVRRWAPAECRMTPSLFVGPPLVLAVRGIGSTLRARYLASRRAKPKVVRVASSGAGVPSPAAAPKPSPARRARVSVVPLRPLPAFRVPDIAAGMGERPVATLSATLVAPVRARAKAARPVVVSAARKLAVATTPPPPARPTRVAQAPSSAPALAIPTLLRAAEASAPPTPRSAPACAPDEQRINNYATRIAASIGMQPADDLKLFEANGRPLPALAPVLLGMSSFELGLVRASVDLVEGALERATTRWETDAAAARPFHPEGR